MGPGESPLSGRGGTGPLPGNRAKDGNDQDQPQHIDGNIDHEYARHLLDEQVHRLLPPAEANALADHLLTCDKCFRYAQDVAAHERERDRDHL